MSEFNVLTALYLKENTTIRENHQLHFTRTFTTNLPILNWIVTKLAM